MDCSYNKDSGRKKNYAIISMFFYKLQNFLKLKDFWYIIRRFNTSLPRFKYNSTPATLRFDFKYVTQHSDTSRSCLRYVIQRPIHRVSIHYLCWYKTHFSRYIAQRRDTLRPDILSLLIQYTLVPIHCVRVMYLRKWERKNFYNFSNSKFF